MVNYLFKGSTSVFSTNRILKENAQFFPLTFCGFTLGTYIIDIFLLYIFQNIFEEFKSENIPVLQMSTLTEEGVYEVKSEVKKITVKYFLCDHNNFPVLI